jgi:hypothetical protein
MPFERLFHTAAAGVIKKDRATDRSGGKRAAVRRPGQCNDMIVDRGFLALRK